MRLLFLFYLTIELAETLPLFSAQGKLIATLCYSALDVLPCSRVHFCKGEREQTINVRGMMELRWTNRRVQRGCALGARRA